MTKRLKILMAAAFIFMLLLTACRGRKSNAPASVVRDTLIMGSPTDIENTDPQYANNLVSMKIVTQLYDTLMKCSPDGKLSPWLVEKYEEANGGMSYVFTIKKGVKFHNGDELKASDVAFTIGRGIGSPFAGAIFGPVKGAEALSDYEVRVDLKYAYAPFLYAMSTPLSSIVNEKACKAAGDNFGRNPCGTGAYKFVSWEPGNRVTLVAFDDWHGGKAPIKNIIFRVLPDPTTSVIALEKGEVDMLLETPVAERAKIKSNANLRLYEASSHRFYYVGFNMRSPNFSDQRVREAVAKALNREGIRVVASEDTGFLAQNHLTKSIFGFASDVKWYDQDVEGAKSLMRQAGKTSMSVRLVCQDGPPRKAAQVVQDNLKEIGITVNIEVLERAGLIDAGQKGNFDLMVNAWSTPVPDADYTVNFLFTSKMIGAMNYSLYGSKEMDDLILLGEMQLDLNDRLSTYKKITELLKTDIPNIPVYFEMISLAANKDLMNVVPSPSSTYYFYELSW